MTDDDVRATPSANTLSPLREGRRTAGILATYIQELSERHGHARSEARATDAAEER